MHNNPLVSVVMLSYNTKQFLPLAIESILQQSYTNFELIIVEGHSTDGSLDIINQYIEKDSRIRLVYDSGEGIGAALNTGCKVARGELIARMDSDDISFPDRFEREVDFLHKNLDYVLVSGAVQYINEEGKSIGRSFPCTNNKVLKSSLKYSSMIVHPMVMLRKEAYNRSGGYINAKIGEDRIFWSRMAKCGKFANLPTPLGCYRVLNNSLSHIINPYTEIIYHFRNKIIADDEILESDIEMYNALCTYSKKFVRVKGRSTIKRKYDIEIALYIFFKFLLGRKFAELLVCNIKNVYFRFRYK